jgi:CRISPR-associated protein Cas1
LDGICQENRLTDEGREMHDRAHDADVEVRPARRTPKAFTPRQCAGMEGDAARTYFSVSDHLIVSFKDDFFMKERSRRPPLDNVNAFLSLLSLHLVGPRCGVGFGVGRAGPSGRISSPDRPGRPSLALDLMEEMRPVAADRLALSLINRKQVRGNGFRRTESGPVAMDDDTRKEVLVAYQKRKQDEAQHPFLGEMVVFGLVPHIQAALFAQCLRIDLDGYPPFFLEVAVGKV